MGSGRPRGSAGAIAMTLLRREPRQVYRVYREDEFLAGADHQAGGTAQHDAEHQTAPTGMFSRRRRRVQRVAGATMLAGAVGAAGGMFATSGVPSRGARARIHAAPPHSAATSGAALVSPARLPGRRPSPTHRVRAGDPSRGPTAAGRRASAGWSVASGSTGHPFSGVRALAAAGGVAQLGDSGGGAGSQLGLGEFGFER